MVLSELHHGSRPRPHHGSIPPTLTTGVAVLMTVQALLGLLLSGEYRDVAWIRAAWFGNDWITLTVAVPALLLSLPRARRGSTRALLVCLGVLGYAAYNYAYYMLGAALNPFFLLYVLAFVVSVGALIQVLAIVDPGVIASGVQPRMPARTLGGYFIFVAVGLSLVWTVQWAAHVFAGRPTPVEPEAFRLIAALDLSLMVPALGCGGLLLWRRRPWGYLIASIAGVQGTLYLLVLALGSAVAVHRGLVPPPGEVPVWGMLASATCAATVTLLWFVRGESLADRSR